VKIGWRLLFLRISNVTKKEIKYITGVLIFLFSNPITNAIHEIGHFVIGTLFGWHVRRIVIDWETAFIQFYEDASTLGVVEVALIYVGGGLFLGAFILSFAEFFGKEFRIFAIPVFVYGIWEAGRGIIIWSGPPMSLYALYMETLQPVVNIIACAIYLAIAIIMYRLESYYYD